MNNKPASPGITRKVWSSAKRTSTKPQCRICGTDSPTPLCLKCDEQAKASIRSAISASSVATRSCPTCKGSGTTLQKIECDMPMPHRCPMCHGRKFLAASLPLGLDVEVAKLDIGMERKLLDWRVINKIGGIRGLPRFSGTAFATNGILVAIRRDNGEVVIGHMDSFDEVPTANAQHSEHSGRKTKLQRLMEEFA